MAKLPDLTGKELIAALEEIGFQIMRQKVLFDKFEIMTYNCDSTRVLAIVDN